MRRIRVLGLTAGSGLGEGLSPGVGMGVGVGLALGVGVGIGVGVAVPPAMRSSAAPTCSRPKPEAEFQPPDTSGLAVWVRSVTTWSTLIAGSSERIRATAQVT